jgi:hypothetical protein
VIGKLNLPAATTFAASVSAARFGGILFVIHPEAAPFRNLMKIIRVFVSSPGDVQAERTIADRLIRETAQELGIPISVQYSNLLRDSESLQSRIAPTSRN